MPEEINTNTITDAFKKLYSKKELSKEKHLFSELDSKPQEKTDDDILEKLRVIQNCLSDLMPFLYSGQYEKYIKPERMNMQQGVTMNFETSTITINQSTRFVD